MGPCLAMSAARTDAASATAADGTGPDVTHAVTGGVAQRGDPGYAAEHPDSTESPNNQMKPKQQARTAAIERIVTALQILMLRQMREHAPDLVDIDITMAQTKALYLLVAVGELRMSDLAARLGVTSSTATGLVDRLVELGLATRREAVDRRQVVIAATDAAQSLMERFRELNASQMRRLLAHVDAADLPVIERAFALILTAADAAADHAVPADRLEPDAASPRKGTHP